ncbi:MAG: acylphosphatase [Phycisphaerae bacterium]|nr:acylphosphatase [Phycisphaerae bacterium]
MSVRRTIHFSGAVQGVGFRYTTAGVARAFDVVGIVRNLSDGRVEIVVEGAPDELDRFVGAVHDEMSGLIRDTQTAESRATGQWTGFHIVH